MAKSSSPKRSSGPSKEQRAMRRNQVIFAAMALVVILSMVIAAVAKF
jgi:hypothetical protein